MEERRGAFCAPPLAILDSRSVPEGPQRFLTTFSNTKKLDLANIPF